MKKPRPLLLFSFLAIELILYILILTTVGELLRWTSYFSIVLCFIFSLTGIARYDYLIPLGLFFTVLADFCLVVCNPIRQLGGMIFFMLAQGCYCRYLHQHKANKVTLLIRIVLTILAELICVAVLQRKTDALAVVSIFYYIQLIMNMVDAFLRRKAHALLPVAFVLFILCDTVIGLQVMSSGYLPIPEGSLIHSILFCGFNLAWFFYLPSQVLIALTSKRK